MIGRMRLRVMKMLDSVVGPVVCRLLTRPRRGLPPAGGSAADDGLPPGRILVIRPGGVGDMLLLLPALQRLPQACPGRPVDILCERRNSAPPALAGLEAEIMPYDRRPLLILSRLLRRRYAVTIDSEQFHHFSAVMAFLSRAPLRVGFNVAPRRNGLYTHLAGYDLGGPEDVQFNRLLDALDCTRNITPRPFSGCLAEAALPPLPPFLAALFAKPVLAVHGGFDNPAKQIPPALLDQVCRRAASELGLAPVFVGGRAEAGMAASLAGDGAWPVNTCGRLTLGETAALCRRAAVFLGPDSGISHLAVALGVPAVTVFGPTDPRKWAVAPGRQIVLQRPVPCSPCAIFGYTKPCAERDCLNRITPDDVLAAIGRSL